MKARDIPYSKKSILTYLYLILSIFIIILGLIPWILHYENNITNSNWIVYFITMLIGYVLLIHCSIKLNGINQLFQKTLIAQFNNYKLLEHFKYTKNEWDDFSNKQYTKTSNQYFVVFSVAFLLIICLNVFIEKEYAKNLIPINCLVTLLFSGIGYYLFKSQKKSQSVTSNYKDIPEVKIAQCGILINNTHIISYHNGDGWLKDCYLSKHLEKQTLCFEIYRAQQSHQYYNLLIPNNKIKEASIVIEKINASKIY